MADKAARDAAWAAKQQARAAHEAAAKAAREAARAYVDKNLCGQYEGQVTKA